MRREMYPHLNNINIPFEVKRIYYLRYSNGIEREDMGIMVQQIREADK
jgi:hypothetical protein